MKYENISLMIAQEIVSKMMGKTMGDFGNEEGGSADNGPLPESTDKGELFYG